VSDIDSDKEILQRKFLGTEDAKSRNKPAKDKISPVVADKLGNMAKVNNRKD